MNVIINKSFGQDLDLNYMVEYILYGEKSKLSDFVKNKEEQKTIIKLMDYPGVQVEESDERLYRCSNCNELSNRYYYHIKFYGGKHEPIYTCSRCGHSLEMLRVSEEKQITILKSNGEKTEINCPACGSSKITCDNGCFDWD